ncbi:hypothetical protein AB6N23_12380 [Cellulomonas sp. 179-A 9B4 NHS]|uniref:hypothetical protein n=1 Tax=Cellulomonas sp. 179-A 9B4 NHS TaxID=3142379 RepID=UPI0039A002D3
MLALRVAVAVAIAAATAVLLAVDREAVVPAAWRADANLWATWAAVVGGFVASVDAAVQAHRTRRLDAVRAPAGKLLLAALYEVRDATGLDLDNLGIALYRRGWTGRLHAVEATRRLLSPAHSGIRWRVGKGAIGWAARTGEEVCIDLVELDRLYERLGDLRWARLPAEERLGLTPRDMRRAHGKYAVVLASPVFSGSTVVGVVALDVTNASKARVYTDDVRRAASSAATAVSGMIGS